VSITATVSASDGLALHGGRGHCMRLALHGGRGRRASTKLGMQLWKMSNFTGFDNAYV